VIAIKVEAGTLYRRTQEEMAYDLKRLILHSLTRKYKPPARRRVLDSVTFTIERGEKVGIIGENGSGKSTLLKVVSGILGLTSGSVSVRGRIAPLIELGAGFDPDLSLKENIIYYGVLLGFTKAQMLDRVTRILDFAELSDRINEPLKALSSGMNARLAFAVATDEHPDVLLLDEVLSVGDLSFRAKSEARLRDLWGEHSTIVLVSHALDFVQSQCNRVLWLRQGRLVADGDPADIIAQYQLWSETASQSRHMNGVATYTAEIPQFENEQLSEVPFVSTEAGGHLDGVSYQLNGEPWLPADDYVRLPPNAEVSLLGWAYDPVADAAGAGLLLEIDGERAIEISESYSIHRPDVESEFPNRGLSRTGFAYEFAARELGAGTHRLRVAVVAQNKEDVFFLSNAVMIDVHTEPPPVSQTEAGGHLDGVIYQLDGGPLLHAGDYASLPPNANVSLFGWAYDPFADAAGSGLLLEIDGEQTFDISESYFIDRPDVERELPNRGLSQTGFACDFAAQELGAGMHSLRVAVVAQNQDEVFFLSGAVMIDVHTEPSATSPDGSHDPPSA
jgi:ABC-type polysaccharide/polyol phosphate transport system ATPase subunit